MKTKSQKLEELGIGKELAKDAKVFIFTDLSQVPTSKLRLLRRDLKKIGATVFVMKKRLLGLLLKERGVDFDPKQSKMPIATVFSNADLEQVAAPVYKVFAGLEVQEGGDKQMWTKKLLGGYDVKGSAVVDAAQIVFIGKLPPREVLLAQLLGMIAAPIKSFLYVLDQKSKQTK